MESLLDRFLFRDVTDRFVEMLVGREGSLRFPDLRLHTKNLGNISLYKASVDLHHIFPQFSDKHEIKYSESC